MTTDKQLVHDFWNEASCGEELYLRGEDARQQFLNQAQVRYDLEPYIIPFAGFDKATNLAVLEIGVGLGADHQHFAQAGAKLSGCDLTPRAIERTQQRLALFGFSSNLQVADAENLPYSDASFDIVYSWGVIHHSPNTPLAVKEIERVLRPGGQARVMIYHTHSMVGYMLWFRYALVVGRPFRTLASVYAEHLESPGTKAYTVAEAKQLFTSFSDVRIDTVLTHGDLLSSAAGQRHKGTLLTVARKLFPRRLVRWLLPKHGLFMLITATK
jgi:ubiquinone/menaquinone biosynthesis C-methylase UbiE